MRRLTGFVCEGAWCAATLDTGDSDTGLLIVSGGNEIRSGAHAGQASLAARLAHEGFPVFRYDRRGVGDSEGENPTFRHSGPDIAAAIAAFKAAAPHVSRVVAFGNCDAAAALMLFAPELPRLFGASQSMGYRSGRAGCTCANLRCRYPIPLLGAAQKSAQPDRPADG